MSPEERHRRNAPESAAAACYLRVKAGGLTTFGLLFVYGFALFFVFGCGDSGGARKAKAGYDDISGELVVYSAASLTDSIRDIAINFERIHPGIDINVNVGSSAQLAKQIAHGAPADVFLSAHSRWMDYLEDRRMVTAETRFEPLGNRLVVVGRSENSAPIASVNALLTVEVRRIAIADYNSVPAGIYAREVLERLGVWQAVLPKLIVGGNVRTAMAYVEHGEADYGIVYATDLRVGKHMKEVFQLPLESQPEIRYSFGSIKDAVNSFAADAFIIYLKSASARQVFEKHGFKTRL